MTELLRWGAATHPGQVRANNEDNYVADQNVFVVADGMGGHQAGEVASEMAANTLRDRLGGGARSMDVTVAAVVEANASIFHGAHTKAEQQGMGTTLTALVLLLGKESVGPQSAPGLPTAEFAVITPDTIASDAAAPDSALELVDITPGQAAIAEPNSANETAAHTAAQTAAPTVTHRLALVNVGDSRTYLWRNGRLRRATIDHSYVQELVATGHITEEDARTHPRRNIVTRALGIEPNVRVDTWELAMVRGDRFVLCSDGLVDEVVDADIAEIVAANDDPQAAADALVARANGNGGRDNITVVVVDVLVGNEPIAPADDGDDSLALAPNWDTPASNPSMIEAEAVPHGRTSTGAGALAGAGAAAAPQAQRSSKRSSQPSAHAAAASTLRLRARGGKPGRRMTMGLFLFMVALAAIVVITVAVIAAAIKSDSNTPPATTNPPVTTVIATVAPSTTRVTTTTVRRTTTTAGAPSTTLAP